VKDVRKPVTVDLTVMRFQSDLHRSTDELRVFGIHDREEM
jgi:hypothetical protein